MPVPIVCWLQGGSASRQINKAVRKAFDDHLAKLHKLRAKHAESFVLARAGPYKAAPLLIRVVQ